MNKANSVIASPSSKRLDQISNNPIRPSPFEKRAARREIVHEPSSFLKWLGERKRALIWFITLFTFCIVLCNLEFITKKEVVSKAGQAAEQANISLPFSEGEQLIYDVYYKKLKVGKSILTFHGEKVIDGKNAYHITFSTKVPGLKDVEEIYADQQTFLPLRVLRQIDQIGSFRTTINEEYDQKAFQVRIKKQGKFLSKKFTIQKKAPIHNAILLPYYYRAKPAIANDQKFKVTLPTADFDVVFKGEETISTYLGEYSTYVFSSVPAKFTFWLSVDKKRIPLKIKSLTVQGYSLIIRSIGSTKE